MTEDNKRHNWSILTDILTTQCPKCRSHKLFIYRTYDLKRFLKMYPSCPNCGQDFRQEPGFYFGAMYFSYAINIAIMVTFGLGFEWLINPVKLWPTLLSVFLPPLVLAPLTYRLSRSINLYVFGRY